MTILYSYNNIIAVCFTSNCTVKITGSVGDLRIG